MIITRLFSKKSEESMKGAGLAAAGTIGAVGANKLRNKITEKNLDYLFFNELTAEDKEAIKDKLLEKAKKQGIRVIEDPEFNNSAYTGHRLGTKYRDQLAKEIRNARKSGVSRKKIEGMINKLKDSSDNTEKAWNSLGKDRIILGNGENSGTDVLSHELGHAQYLRPGRSKSIVGKAAHHLIPISGATISRSNAGKVIRGTMFVNGLNSGIKKEKDKKEGKKTNTWNKVRSVAVPSAIVAPLLIAEGKASLNGLKTMKELGASKELMKQSRKRLGAAYNAYISEALNPVAMGASGELVGRGVGKIIPKSKDQSEK